MDLRHLRYFLAVAESLNFTAAAKKLGIAQPPLSTQIKQLEAEIGQPLFHRTSRKVILTDAGFLLCREASAMVEQADRITRKFADLREGRGTSMKIGVDEEIADLKVARQVRKFVKKHRGIRCEVIFFRAGENPSLENLDALIVDRSDWMNQPAIELGNSPIWLILSRKHRLAERAEIQLVDLVGEHLLFSPPGFLSKVEQLIFDKDPAGMARMSTEWVTHGVNERIWLAEAGFGVTIASHRDVIHSGATAVPFSLDSGFLCPVLGYWENHRHAGVEALLSHFTERLTS